MRFKALDATGIELIADGVTGDEDADVETYRRNFSHHHLPKWLKQFHRRTGMIRTSYFVIIPDDTDKSRGFHSMEFAEAYLAERFESIRLG